MLNVKRVTRLLIMLFFALNQVTMLRPFIAPMRGYG